MLQSMWRTKHARARTLYLKARDPGWRFTGRRTYATPVPSGTLLGGDYPSRLTGHIEGGDRSLEHSASGEKDRQAFDLLGSEPRTLLGISTTSAPSRTDVSKLVQKLRSNTWGTWLESDDSSLELTLLFTPSYAQSALSSELPIQILARLVNGNMSSSSIKTIDVVTAVVDRLPSVYGNPEGVEGLAYLLKSNTLPVEREAEPLEPSAQKPGSLTFVPFRQAQKHLIAVQLPLAQTMFSTTLPSTLVRSRYQFSQEAMNYKVCETEKLEACTVSIPVVNKNWTRDYTIPLTPATPGRRVEASMGNIVRKLSASLINDESRHAPFTVSNSEASIPASQELESAISTYFEELHIQPEPVQVWALIIPSLNDMPEVKSTAAALLNLDQTTIRRSWKTAPGDDDSKLVLTTVADIVNDGIPALLASGGRLCKVLSGGGGWGKKAGLLSLDPDTSYSTRDLRHDRGWEFSFDEDDSPQAMEKQQRQALGEVVKEGEGVMFFLAPGQKPPAQDIDPSISRLTFGALPSSIDETLVSAEDLDPETSGNSTKRDLPQVEHHQGIFGALSEGGMAIKQIRHTMDGPQQYAESKLDVPYARLSIASGVESRKTATQGNPQPFLDEPAASISVPIRRVSTGNRDSYVPHTKRPSRRSEIEDAWESLPPDSHDSARVTRTQKAPRLTSKQEHEIISLIEGFARSK